MPGTLPLIALHGVIRRYAWGSATAIPGLLGIEPTGEPAAELWLGAHRDDPARAPDHEATLDELIARDPVGLLGPDVVERFGPHLPFLLKVLAPAAALSMQVHPDLAQARAGFAAEEARGVPREASERNYKDANHKPELLCALTEFDTLCGFRPVDQTLRLINALDVAELAPYGELLARPDGLRAAFTRLLELDRPGRAALCEPVIQACRRMAAARGAWSREAAFAVLAAADAPGDIGVVLTLLLNAVHLEPGEAIFLGAGNVHAYLRGVGVELMANSDNVLRCGLTPKHVDVPELLRITDFAPLPEPRCPSRPGVAGERAFQTPVPDLALGLVAVDGPVEITAAGPQILLCTDGSAEVTSGAGYVVLSRGHAVFVAAGQPCKVAGKGTLFRATTGHLSRSAP